MILTFYAFYTGIIITAYLVNEWGPAQREKRPSEIQMVKL